MGAIDHVAVVVRDADRAIATFSRLLGYRVVGDEPVAAAGVRLVYLAAGDDPAATTLQLVAPVAAGKVAEYLAEHGEGLHHVCFATGDLERALRAAGQPDPDGVFVGGRGRPCAFLTERPHGALIELTEIDNTEGAH